jgi:hypothetical protein
MTVLSDCLTHVVATLPFPVYTQWVWMLMVTRLTGLAHWTNPLMTTILT